MQVAATATGFEPFRERFKGYSFEEAPPLAEFRCNLTGLSQVHNLYLVAIGSHIYVYEPLYPTQRIGGQPLLKFTSEPTSPHLTGVLDRRNPHAINNLVIQFLGNEEVVAVVRDDGDVDAFLVRHIVQAVARRREQSSSIGVLANEIRPFFQSNVGNTAWGLAIHAQTRILATSSNACEVRVFRFGLLHTDHDEDSEDDTPFPDTDEENDIQAGMERKTDVTHQVINGKANIPHIAFCNTGDDPEGRWLLTTDISGDCRVMDLHELTVVQKFRCGYTPFDPTSFHTNSGGFDRINAGWIIMFLDRRSFHEEDTVHAALGLEDGDVLPHIKRANDVWDLSKTVHHLPEYSEPFVFNNSKRRRNEQRTAGPLSEAAETVNSGEQPEDDDEVASDSSSDGGAPLVIETEVVGRTSDPIEPTHEQSGPDSTTLDDAEGDAEYHNSGEDEASLSDSALDSDPESMALIDDGEDPDDDMTEDTIPFASWYNGESLCANRPQFATINPPPRDHKFPPCPILHASVRNIYLLQPLGDLASASAYEAPTVGLNEPLRQTIQQAFEHLRYFERLNMAAYIAPLGIVILASQKGRAIVMSLTKIPAGTQYPPEMESVTIARPQDTSKPRQKNVQTESWGKKSVYAMRVECILPFTQQEKANQRPFAPLHGIAASPLQGCEDGSARWRVMMYYQDHSILSYEIGRKGDGDGASGNAMGVDVQELVI